MFIRDVVASVARPLLELKGVAKITLASGEKRRRASVAPASAFAFPGNDYRPILETGRFELSVGLSADRTKLVDDQYPGGGRLSCARRARQSLLFRLEKLRASYGAIRAVRICSHEFVKEAP